MSIKTALNELHTHIPSYVKLVCVSKFHPADSVLEAYSQGERIFGESRVQELEKKQLELPKDIEWHFIGHLQTNKIKYIIPYVKLIHGIDSFKLLTEVNKEAAKAGCKVNCLLQVHIAEEETKFGFDCEELLDMFGNKLWKSYKNVSICGLMGMATFTDDIAQIRREFKMLKQLFDEIKKDYFLADKAFSELSMGMSDDYRIAIEEGATMVRIGTTIFGSRQY